MWRAVSGRFFSQASSEVAGSASDLNRKIMDAFNSIIDKNILSKASPYSNKSVQVLESIPKYNPNIDSNQKGEFGPKMPMNASSDSQTSVDIFKRHKLSPKFLHKV